MTVWVVTYEQYNPSMITNFVFDNLELAEKCVRKIRRYVVAEMQEDVISTFLLYDKPHEVSDGENFYIYIKKQEINVIPDNFDYIADDHYRGKTIEEYLADSIQQNPSSWGVIEVYEYYDQPRLFLAKNPFGQKYIVFWIGVDESYEWDRWLYVPVSDSMVTELRSGDMKLRDAIDKYEGSGILRVTTFNSNKPTIVENIEINEILESEKPAKDAVISSVNK